ncbi:hypothetical protein J6590_093209 [Homalodisca vitripennis]|nr:hypothetical protein J6590_093209 [Homalodisca vitripennis]
MLFIGVLSHGPRSNLQNWKNVGTNFLTGLRLTILKKKMLQKRAEEIEILIKHLPVRDEINQKDIHEWLVADDLESEFINQDFIDMVLHPDNLILSDHKEHITADEIFNVFREVYYDDDAMWRTSARRRHDVGRYGWTNRLVDYLFIRLVPQVVD